MSVGGFGPRSLSGRVGGALRASAVVLAVLWGLALGVGSAQAAPPALISHGPFKVGTQWPVGVGVDQSSGDVYAAGLIDFEAYGSTKNPAGWVSVNKFSALGSPLEPSSFGESNYSGVAVNPVNGDVYVLSNAFVLDGAPVITMFDPGTGAVVGAPFEVPASNNAGPFTVVQIAADSSGNVYVPVVPENRVIEYSPTGTELKAFTGGAGAGALKGPTGVAVDSSGNVWVADNGDNRIEELGPVGEPVGEVKSEGVESVALDGRGNVLAMVRNKKDFCGEVFAPCQHLVEYNSAGAQVADLGAGSFGNQEERSAAIPGMVAVNGSSGLVYVSDPLKGLVWVFIAPSAPSVGREVASEVTTSEAKLGALVRPGGIATSYRFEYGTSDEYGQSTPFPEGSAGEGVVSRTVWASAHGLAPGTTYHYRVVAINELGTVYGPDQTFTTLTAAQTACPNSDSRDGFSAKLPDCRAYELVTVPPKDSSQLNQAGPAAVSGEALGFFTKEPLPDSVTGGSYYLVKRGPEGWTSEGIMPLESYSGILCPYGNAGELAYSADMSKAMIDYGNLTRASNGELQGACNGEGLQVVQGEPVGYRNLLVRDNATGTFQLVNRPPAGVTPADAIFKGASPDLSHVFFTEMAPLTPEAPYGVENLFEWDEGALRLVTMVKGVSVKGSLAAEGAAAETESPISSDGSHVLFTSSGGLYDRIDGERTVQIDEAQEGASGLSGDGSFQAANADGSKVLFLDSSRLTSDSTAETGEPDLYECVLPVGATRCALKDLTVAKAGEHADVLGVAPLGSKDSSHVYFTAKGILATNKREYEYTDTDGKVHRVIEEAVSGHDNLYTAHDGSIAYIATLSGAFDSAVSPDGSWLSFDSTKSLTGYDNIQSNNLPADEIFLYSSAGGRLQCASCNPSGEPPVTGGAVIPPPSVRPLSDGGRLFFETGEALVPSDTDGGLDVYEYDGGEPYLISSGTGTIHREKTTIESLFVGASETGDDVFFIATQQLLPQDTNEDAFVVYDARVDGGFPAIAAPPACTTADACRTPVSPQPSVYGAPSSQTFSGVGNLMPSTVANAKERVKPKKAKPKRHRCKRGFVKRKAKCVTTRVHKKARKSNRPKGRR